MNMHTTKGKVSFVSALLLLSLFCTPISTYTKHLTLENAKKAANNAALFAGSGICGTVALSSTLLMTNTLFNQFVKVYFNSYSYTPHVFYFTPMEPIKNAHKWVPLACTAIVFGYGSYYFAKRFHGKEKITPKEAALVIVPSTITVLGIPFGCNLVKKSYSKTSLSTKGRCTDNLSLQDCIKSLQHMRPNENSR